MKQSLPKTVVENRLGTWRFATQCKMKPLLLTMIAVVALSLAIAPSVATASVIGYLGNFDVINDTGQTAYGFEIELEGLHSSDISDVFGGPGRGFPSGRGYDPATSVERYGSPTISEYSNGAIFGTRVTYSALYDGTNWDYGTPTTPSGTFVTPGDNCWSGGGLGYGPDCPCDHFGVGTIGNPTKTTYSWLLEASPGVLTTANGVVQLPAPVWNVIPDPNPAAPPQVVAQVESPEPEGFEFGDALWVKVFTTEFEDPTELEDLVGDNAHVQQVETEVEWQLLQKDFNNPLSGMLESGYGVPVGPNAASILRRYEFFEFSGAYDPVSHEAQFDPPYGDSHPGPNDVGTYLGSQNAAVNLDVIPEPQTCVLLIAALALIGVVARGRKAGGSLDR
jgi:hypothetical protein